MKRKDVLRWAKLIFMVGLFLLGVKPSFVFGWEPSVLPGHTEETVGSLILKSGDTVLGWVRMAGIILIILAIILAGIVIAFGQFTQHYGMMQNMKYIAIVSAVLGLFIILAAPLITSVILKWFHLDDKWTRLPGDTEGFELPVIGGFATGGD